MTPADRTPPEWAFDWTAPSWDPIDILAAPSMDDALREAFAMLKIYREMTRELLTALHAVIAEREGLRVEVLTLRREAR